MMFEPIIIVHGGSGKWSQEFRESALAGVKEAAKRGYSVLTSARNAMDAVEAAVVAMEDNPLFNAGHGSVPNCKGNVEMDALVIDGETMNSGAVCGVRGCPNPVKMARLVMDKTKHCLLTGEGAQDFMESQGIHAVPDSELRRNRGTGSSSSSSSRDDPPGGDTVGAVAMDAHGNFAAATSTGGTTGKLPGRVGDSPIIGAGAYADSTVGAVSTTGDGEPIMKVCLARKVCEFLEKGESAHEAAARALSFMTERVGGQAGVIVLSKDGNKCQVAHNFTAPTMAWAAVSEGHVTWGIEQDQEDRAPILPSLEQIHQHVTRKLGNFGVLQN